MVFGGCGGGPRPISPDVISAPDGTASSSVWADWDDIGASIGSGFAIAESATLDTTSADDRVTWSIITIENHSGLVAVSRDPNAQRDSRGCEHLTVTAQIDGDKGKDRSAVIVSRATHRLKELAGVEWAPRR